MLGYGSELLDLLKIFPYNLDICLRPDELSNLMTIGTCVKELSISLNTVEMPVKRM